MMRGTWGYWLEVHREGARWTRILRYIVSYAWYCRSLGVFTGNDIVYHDPPCNLAEDLEARP